LAPQSSQRARATSFTRFLDYTQRRITICRTPLDQWPARRRDLYLTIHNIHNRHTSMPPVGFEPTISAGEWPRGHWNRLSSLLVQQILRQYRDAGYLITHLQAIRTLKLRISWKHYGVKSRAFELNGTEVTSNYRKSRSTWITIIYNTWLRMQYDIHIVFIPECW
jgi:hypothetical protein